jgi:lincosamide nucleotidyltransferase A/C/D/E
MTQQDVLELLDLAGRVGAAPWVDGGWGVDAALGRQTRKHEDLDILIERRHEAAFADALHGRGFSLVDRDDTRPWNYVLGDHRGRQVDFHVIECMPYGDWHYGPEDGPSQDVIPADALLGTGRIGHRLVRCLTPEAQVRYHTGYAVDVDDWADVSALCERFGIDVPSDYDAFRSGRSGPGT